jgi:hypothetical protein
LCPIFKEICGKIISALVPQTGFYTYIVTVIEEERL